MPQKLCIAAMLVFLLLQTEGRAQRFALSGIAENADHPARSSGSTPQPIRERSDNNGQFHLERPAVHLTPDCDVGSVQQAGYSEASDETGFRANSAVATAAATGEMDESPPDATSGIGIDRNAGFPTLAPRASSRSGGSATSPASKGIGSIITVISSLSIVLGLFFVTAWAMRRSTPKGSAALPSDVFEVLGRAPLNHRQQVHLVRCGSKLLLVSLTPESAETLTEIDDPDEVARLAGLCKSNHTGSATAAFRQVLHQFAGQPAEPGYFGRSDSPRMMSDAAQKLEDLHG